ncbi:MAG: LolA family protein [Jatrophihabitantaceae bacterium]
MKAPGIVKRHPELRWLASATIIIAGILAVASSVSGVFRDDSTLRATGPDQLVAQVRTPHLGGYTGTILSKVDLGLPAPLTNAIAADRPVGGDLLSGAHTMRYWYGGADRQRVAITEQSAEQDVFRNGDDVLLWDTESHVLQRRTVTDEAPGVLPLSVAAPASLTPPQLADRVLQIATVDDATTTLRSGDPVLGRPTYELVVEPSDKESLIGSVHIQVDGAQSVPLAVQVYPRGGTDPVVDVAFTSINFAEPQDRNFTFTPPATARRQAAGTFDLGSLTTTGTGWTQVGTYSTSSSAAGVIAGLLGPKARTVKGAWGRGRLLTGQAISVLVTARGRVVLGAVTPSVLYRAVPR